MFPLCIVLKGERAFSYPLCKVLNFFIWNALSKTCCCCRTQESVFVLYVRITKQNIHVLKSLDQLEILDCRFLYFVLGQTTRQINEILLLFTSKEINKFGTLKNFGQKMIIHTHMEPWKD